MAQMRFVICSLLPLVGLACLSLAAEPTREPATSSASTYGETYSSGVSAFDPVGSETEEEAPYLISPGEEGTTQAKFEVEKGLNTSSSTSTADIAKRNATALGRAALYLLIPLLLSFIVHEALVYPEVKKLQEATRAETGAYLSDDKAYDAVLEKDFVAGASSLVVGLMGLILGIMFMYRLSLVLFPRKSRRGNEDVRDTYHAGKEEQTVSDVGDLQEAADAKKEFQEPLSAADLAGEEHSTIPELADATEVAGTE